VEKFWHKKLVKDADEEQEVATEYEQKEGDEPLDGEEETTNDLHEFTNKNQYSTTQVLGKEAEEDAAKLDLDDDDDKKEFFPATNRENDDPAETEKKSVQKKRKKRELSAEPTPREEKRLDSEQNAEDTDQVYQRKRDGAHGQSPLRRNAHQDGIVRR